MKPQHKWLFYGYSKVILLWVHIRACLFWNRLSSCLAGCSVPLLHVSAVLFSIPSAERESLSLQSSSWFIHRCSPRAVVSLGFQQPPKGCHVSNRWWEQVPVRAYVEGSCRADGSREINLELPWEWSWNCSSLWMEADGKNPAYFFPVLLFFRSLCFQLHYHCAIPSCLLLRLIFFSLFLSFLLFPPLFLLVLYLSSCRAN